MCSKEIGIHTQNFLIVLGSIVNIIIFFGGGGPIWPFNEHENLHFDHECEDIHMIFKKNEESGYGLDLDLLITISY